MFSMGSNSIRAEAKIVRKEAGNKLQNIFFYSLVLPKGSPWFGLIIMVLNNEDVPCLLRGSLKQEWSNMCCGWDEIFVLYESNL